MLLVYCVVVGAAAVIGLATLGSLRNSAAGSPETVGACQTAVMMDLTPFHIANPFAGITSRRSAWKRTPGAAWSASKRLLIPMALAVRIGDVSCRDRDVDGGNGVEDPAQARVWLRCVVVEAAR